MNRESFRAHNQEQDFADKSFTFDPLSKLYSFHFCAFWQLHKNHWYHSQEPWHFESHTLNRNNCEARISPQDIFHDFLVACFWVIARIRSFPIKNIWGIGDSGQPQIVGYLHISTNTPPSSSKPYAGHK